MNWYILPRDDANAYECMRDLLPEPVDVCDFPEVIMSLAESMPHSHLAIVDDVAYFRLRNTQLLLIARFCDSYALKKIVDGLVELGYTVKSLQCVNKDMDAFSTTRKVYGKSWYAQRGVWDIDTVLHSSGTHSKHLRRAFRQAENYNITIDENDSTLEDTMMVMNKWVVEAKDRHYMVIKGDTIRFIERYFTFPIKTSARMKFVRKDGELIGFVGYDVVNNQVFICELKVLAVNGFADAAKFVWISTINSLLQEYPDAPMILCGMNSDAIKEYVGLEWKRCYTLFSKLRLDDNNTHV